MNSLPDVLLQLLCQSLPTQDLLRFARCSHQTRHASASPFAWATAVVAISLCKLDGGSYPPTTLARHAGVALRWDLDSPSSVGELMAKVSQRFARIAELDADRDLSDWPPLTNESFAALLSHSATRQISSLALFADCVMEGSGFRLPSDLVLPQLRSLRLHCSPAAWRNSWAQLVRLSPGLTALQLRSPSDAVTHFELALPELQHPASVASRLRDLHLIDTTFARGNFAKMFQSPTLAQLEVLTLTNPTLPFPGPSGFRGCEDRLQRLHTLHLRALRDHCVSWLLRSAADLPSLRLLTFLPATQVRNPLAGPALPQPRDLSELLTRRPCLRVVIYRSFTPQAGSAPLSPMDQMRTVYPAAADDISQNAPLLLQHVRFDAPPQ